MSTKLRKTVVVVAMMATAAGLYHIYQGRTGSETDRTSIGGVGAREGQRGPASIREESFLFNKWVKVNFDFSDEVVEHTFDGNLFIDWTEERGERVATVSMAMPGHNTDVFIRARYTEDFSLRCLEQPRELTEEESDYVLLLKNLVLDYSFRTNRDDNGDYSASLREEDVGEGRLKFIKSKNAYLDPEKKGLKIIKSRHEINLINGAITKTQGEEHIELLFDQSTASAETKYRLEASTPANKRPDLNFLRALGECRSDFSTQIKIIARVSPADFKDLMLKMETSDRASRQDSARKILRALRAQPELFDDFMDWVPSTLEDRKLAGMAIGILGNLGTPAAQKELLGIFNSATDKNKFVQNLVLNTFTLTESPLTGESREFLKSQMEGGARNLVEGAAYALGSSIQNDPTGHESRGDLQYLITALDRADGIKSQLVYLDALGNSGSPDAFSTFQKYARSDNELLREKAIMGLRFINNEGKTILYQAALNDPSPRVRQAAQEAMKIPANE